MNEVQIGIIDSDTDCSVLSEDILPSSYPVKPRAHTKPVGADGKFLRRHTYGMRKEISSAEVDDAIGFLHDVNTSQRTLFDAELERENLESNYEVFI